jgi:hypothetical protein
MTDALDAARERMARELFAKWDPRELEDLVRLLCKLAQEIEGATTGVRDDGGR